MRRASVGMSHLCDDYPYYSCLLLFRTTIPTLPFNFKQLLIVTVIDILLIDMFRTDSQPCRLRNRTPVTQRATGCVTGRPDDQPTVLASPMRNRTAIPLRYRVGYVDLLCNGPIPLRSRSSRCPTGREKSP